MTTQYQISDVDILSMIEQDNCLGWENLYDKYALDMYVAVLSVIDDELLAEEILRLLFLKLKVNKALLQVKQSLFISLLHHTYLTALGVLENQDNLPQEADIHSKAYPILNILVYKSCSISNAAELLDISTDDVKQGLSDELSIIKNRLPDKSVPVIEQAIILEQLAYA